MLVRANQVLLGRRDIPLPLPAPLRQPDGTGVPPQPPGHPRLPPHRPHDLPIRRPRPPLPPDQLPRQPYRPRAHHRLPVSRVEAEDTGRQYVLLLPSPPFWREMSVPTTCSTMRRMSIMASATMMRMPSRLLGLFRSSSLIHHLLPPTKLAHDECFVRSTSPHRGNDHSYYGVAVGFHL